MQECSFHAGRDEEFPLGPSPAIQGERQQASEQAQESDEQYWHEDGEKKGGVSVGVYGGQCAREWEGGGHGGVIARPGYEWCLGDLRHELWTQGADERGCIGGCRVAVYCVHPCKEPDAVIVSYGEVAESDRNAAVAEPLHVSGLQLRHPCGVRCQADNQGDLLGEGLRKRDKLALHENCEEVHYRRNLRNHLHNYKSVSGGSTHIFGPEAKDVLGDKVVPYLLHQWETIDSVACKLNPGRVWQRGTIGVEQRKGQSVGIGIGIIEYLFR